MFSFLNLSKKNFKESYLDEEEGLYVIIEKSLISDGKDIIYYNKDKKEHRNDDKPSKIIYLSNKIILKEYKQNGILHRDCDKPSFIFNFRKEKQFSYYKNGKLHRKNKPAKIYFNDLNFSLSHYLDGIKEGIEVVYEYGVMKVSYYKNGKLHREEKPAYTEYNDLIRAEKFYLNGINANNNNDMPSTIDYLNGNIRHIEFTNKKGQKHRDSKPAVISIDSFNQIVFQYWKNGVNYREGDNPSIIKTFNKKYTFLYTNKLGFYHRENKPAEICFRNNKILHYKYYNNHQEDREDGPAVVFFSKTKLIDKIKSFVIFNILESDFWDIFDFRNTKSSFDPSDFHSSQNKF